MKSIAQSGRLTRTTARFPLVFGLALLLVACAGPDRPTRATLYDFGPGATAPLPATRQAPLSPLALGDIEAGGSLDGSAMLYRLAYADANELRPYAQARWSAPPAQLVRQRLREHLSLRRAVLNMGEGAAITRSGGQAPLVLRLELEEFSQVFDSPAASQGVLRLRATAAENTPSGEKLLAQRTVVVRRPAPTADAPGGVQALTAATEAAAEEIDQWLQQLR
ncbi:MAG: membrane integrity-associated transporter subunit PqiC [Ramlibacter sp.]|nr:membrane integrity-associated transporter subunit PqiC [Ramlibacter sp.]